MTCGSIALVAVLLASSTFAEEFPLNDAPSGKHSPVGFGAVQGAKSLTSLENEDFVKRAPMGFQGMRGKKDMIENSEDNSVAEEEYEKRSPMGFHGMRGKKDFLTPDFADSYFIDEYLKRAPMGFQGMRGKKAITDEDYYKRAAMGFQGMRGKKSSEFIFDKIPHYIGDGSGKRTNLLEYTDEYEKRAPSMGFQGMRGKREEFEDEWSKRAPMGFQGMRGKKSLLAEINDLEKKRAMMGFQGMRGKKSDPSVYYNELRPVRSIDYSDLKKKTSDLKNKRLNVGFFASRGKRSELDTDNYAKMSTYDLQDVLADEIAEDLFLRDHFTDRMNVAPLQFYKRSAYGYSGTRGKKIPRWEIRGKFVGVRGKRTKTNYEDTGNSLDHVHSNNERAGLKTSLTTNSGIQ
ncbi:tachykinins isoform X1 [Venturia canescens]|uniref:tachykinins isoform X1 n=1 Tax=Venturia canescens TaxID=32260 RepID=UPI001C9BD71E|nr:tachykinins isoform X1 [Venturia canescens]XP_043279711.1 tachykinins isoform X1 [Venturia canescens]